jgi:hypothetical protein
VEALRASAESVNQALFNGCDIALRFRLIQPEAIKV